MKKLALGIATLLFAATPAFACPDMESGGGHDKDTIKTADKAKKPAKDAKGQPQDKAKKTDDTKTAKPKQAPKKTDKVSRK